MQKVKIQINRLSGASKECRGAAHETDVGFRRAARQLYLNIGIRPNGIRPCPAVSMACECSYRWATKPRFRKSTARRRT